MFSLNVADVHMELCGELDSKLLQSSFAPFILRTDSGTPDCRIHLCGGDGRLALEPIDKESGWLFSRDAGGCIIKRRERDGRVVWMLRCNSEFTELEYSWNPEIYFAHFNSYEHAWNSGSGAVFLALHLLSKNGFVLHGSGIDLDGNGMLFLGPSGAGKSTISGIIDRRGGEVLSDEHPVIRQYPCLDNCFKERSDFRVYGSPWPSSGGFARNQWVKLKRIYFLEKSLENTITPLIRSEAFMRLIHTTIIPWQAPVLFDPCLKTVEALLANVPAAVLSFRPDEEVVDVIRQDLATERIII